MIENVIAQSVFRNRIIDIIPLVRVPIFGKLFFSLNKHALVAIFVILNHRKRGICLA